MARFKGALLVGTVVCAATMCASASAVSVRPPQFLIETTAGKIQLLDASGRLVRTVARVSLGSGASPLVSPEGSTIAWGTAKGLVVAPLAGGAARLLLPEPACNNNTHECLSESFAWSPDGSQLLVSGLGPQRTRLEIVSATTGHGRTIATGPGFDDLSWSPNGKWALYATSPFQPGPPVRLVRVRGDGTHPHTIFSLPNTSLGIIGVSWSRDSQKAAFTYLPTRASLVQLSTYTVASGSVKHRRTRGFYIAAAGAPAWSPDSTQLAFSVEEDGARTLTVANGATRLLSVPHAGAEYGGPAWTNTGLYLSDGGKLWRSPDGRSKPVALFRHIPGYPNAYMILFEPLH